METEDIIEAYQTEQIETELLEIAELEERLEVSPDYMREELRERIEFKRFIIGSRVKMVTVN